MYMCVYACIYIYIYIYTHTYIRSHLGSGPEGLELPWSWLRVCHFAELLRSYATLLQCGGMAAKS